MHGCIQALASCLFLAIMSLSLLMLFAQQVVDGLHRIEGRERNFNEDCVPVAHRTIPQSLPFLLLLLMKPVVRST